MDSRVEKSKFTADDRVPRLHDPPRVRRWNEKK